MFLNGFILDFLYAIYTKNIIQDKWLSASVYSGLIGLCGLFWYYEVNKDIITGVSYVFGLAFGTYFAKYIKTK